MHALDSRRVLIVEDDYLVASDLARHLKKAGARVLGPSATVADGHALVHEAEAAVLDIHLRDTLVFPLADKLQAAGVPFVFYTGEDTDELPARYRSVSVLRKPVDAVQAFEAYFGNSDPAEEDDIVKLLPKLRVMARIIINDPAAADRLVERALERAIETYDQKAAFATSGDWLMDVLIDAAKTHKGSLSN